MHGLTSAADAGPRLQAHPNVRSHLNGERVPVHLGQLKVSHRFAEIPIIRNLFPAILARPNMALHEESSNPCGVSTGKQRQIVFSRMIHSFLFVLFFSANFFSFVRAFAICERTVAFEHSSRFATSSAGSPSISLRTRAARSRGVSRSSPSANQSRCSDRSSAASGVSAWLPGASAISQKA